MDNNQPTPQPDPVKPPEGELLGDEAPEGGQTLDQIEKAKRRITHVDSTFDPLAILKDLRFERIMFVAGIGLMVALTIIGFAFYNTIELREEKLTLASQVESDFYARLLKDKNFVFNYRLDEGLFEYDPLLNTSVSVTSAQGVTNVSSQSTGGYSVTNNTNARVIDGVGTVILELGDTAIHIDDLLLAPDGNSVVFDVRPSNEQAENKFGLRLGAYEFVLGADDFQTLVSDASTGARDPAYDEHFVQILSFSPNGRYLAYTNQSNLWLYDRLSKGSVNVAELDSAAQEPDTGWNERTEPEPIEETETETDES